MPEKKTRPKQKKTPATQLLYEVPDTCTRVCSSLTGLVKCVLLTLDTCTFVSTSSCLHWAQSWLLWRHVSTASANTARLTWCNAAADSDRCQAPALSSHRTAPALHSLAAFLQHCTEPWKVWEPTGQVCGCGKITQQKWLYLWDLNRGGDAMLCCVMWACSWVKLGNPCSPLS